MLCIPGIDTQSPRSLLSALPPARYHGLRNPDTASEGSAQTTDSLATSATGSPHTLRSISSYLHVLHSKRATTDLDDETFNALVDFQLSSKVPIRAPWFRTAEQQAVRVSRLWCLESSLPASHTAAACTRRTPREPPPNDTSAEQQAVRVSWL